MSESVRNDVSSESLCTVIENYSDNTKPKENSTTNTTTNNNSTDNELNETASTCPEDTEHEVSDSSVNKSKLESTEDDEGSLNNSIEDSCPTKPIRIIPVLDAPKARSRLKKSVSFDPNDEKIRKFITGEPIVDQQNPFKNHTFNGSSLQKKKKTPPPVPTKRSTLSVRKTVTQQLREREREKEKERERLKNEANNRKSNGGTSALSSPDEYISTEEVLKQSKYVKTYIKNPDPFFVYDPTVLARIKFDELRDLADKKPPKKLKLTTQTRERLKDLKNKPTPAELAAASKTKLPTFKKCSKPNYPELADIKVKVGSEPDDNYFSPAEVTKNAKKFDERVKKLHLGSDDDLDEVDGPLTKSESSDELTANSNLNHKDSADPATESDNSLMNVDSIEAQPAVDGTFTNTIKSQEFQEYLSKKGLTLIPKKIPNGAQPIYRNGASRPNAHISFKVPESVQISIDTMDAAQNAKKPSVFQRLLSNSIFASRRKTTPKETIPMPRSLYQHDANTRARENGSLNSTSTPIKRVVLERQSFHGRPRASNLLTAAEANDLKNQIERSRKSFAGDDLSLSISSALTNAEYANGPDNRQSNIPMITTSGLRKPEIAPKPIAKPPRRTLSRDRFNTLQQPRPQLEQQNIILKPKVQRAQVSNNNTLFSLPRENLERTAELQPDGVYFRRTLERQSLIPKRTTLTPTQANDRRQLFGRTASMDRNEILKRTAARGLQNKATTKSANGTLKVFMNSKENLREQFAEQNGPQLTSTPIRVSQPPTYSQNLERKIVSPSTSNTTKPQVVAAPGGGVYVDQLEWDRLRAMKERTDRELYYRVLKQQQQQQQQDAENIYERLPINQVLIQQPIHSTNTLQPVYIEDPNFMRGSPQRNTFSGVMRNRQTKIIDGKAVLASERQQMMPPQTQINSDPSNTNAEQTTTTRSQSVLDGVTQKGSRMGFRRGYESDTETPVILRRKNPTESNSAVAEPRRIGGILTREEILQKVKEFCRKSLNKTPTNQPPQLQAIYAKQPTSTDISPVSYVSVETHQRPGSRMYAAPQVPQRMQSLPQQFIPITHELLSGDPNASTSSPIYAHVIKRSSMQSNQSELYDNPQQQQPPPLQQQQQRSYVIQRENDVQPIYVSRGGTLQRPESAFSPTQYVLVEGDKISPIQLYQQSDIYDQPQYIRPHQLQPMPGAYGYITVREPSLSQQLRPRLHDGRSTPLILDRQSSQQASQIYWTPQHQRLQQQHAGLLPIEISPRYTVKQPYPVPVQQRIEQATNRAVIMNANQIANIPEHYQQQQQQVLQQLQQQQQQQKQQQFSPMMRTNTPTKQQVLQQQQQQVLQQPQQQVLLYPRQSAVSATAAAAATPVPAPSSTEYNSHQQYEWESGSEAGEVQRIMEHQQRHSGESKTYNIFRNLKAKMSRLVGISKR